MAGGTGGGRREGEGIDALLSLLIEFLERLRDLVVALLPGGPLS
jgi:hypothetical protein